MQPISAPSLIGSAAQANAFFWIGSPSIRFCMSGIVMTGVIGWPPQAYRRAWPTMGRFSTSPTSLSKRLLRGWVLQLAIILSSMLTFLRGASLPRTVKRPHRERSIIVLLHPLRRTKTLPSVAFSTGSWLNVTSAPGIALSRSSCNLQTPSDGLATCENSCCLERWKRLLDHNLAPWDGAVIDR